MQIMVALFRLVLQASAAAGVLTCIILLLKRLLGERAGAGLQYAIWFLLLIRLCMPVTPPCPLSLCNLFPSCVRWSVQIQTYTGGQTDSSAFLQTSKVLNGWIASRFPEIFRGMSSDALLGCGVFPWISLLWLCGSGIFFCTVSGQNAAFRRRVKHCSPCEEERVLRILEEGKKAMNVTSAIPVLWCTDVSSPSLYGVFRPSLLLPPEADGITDRELYLAFLHELVHYRRKDILFVWIETFLKAVHWFNPLVWYGFYRMRQDCEIACDAAVLSRVPPQDAELYGQTLLHFVSQNGRGNRVIPVAGLFSRTQKSDIRRRFIMIARFKKPTWKTFIIGAVVLAALGTVGLTGALRPQTVLSARVSSAPSSVSSFTSGLSSVEKRGSSSSTSAEFYVVRIDQPNGTEAVYYKEFSPDEMQKPQEGNISSESYITLKMKDKDNAGKVERRQYVMETLSSAELQQLREEKNPPKTFIPFY